MARLATPAPRRISASEFHDMARAGIFAPDERVELVDGEIYTMAPIGSRHASVVSALAMLFARNAGEAAIVWTQNPVRLSADTELQPDLALLRPRPDWYRAVLPAPADVLFVIEVADATLRYDRNIKLPLYARYEIPEVWIVDLTGRVLRIHREPVDATYRIERECGPDDTVAPVALPAAAVALNAVLAA